ncbi:hypothetical protein CLF_101585 [Clonorchis sinensis]|uniref:Uncharacterized protein n=1 Tax=Clonorchis sinensis TaxID=79923 RepID=G7Y633_CLOSI|nr:hypothetical protein CLF_101585 [Clonorchis sinensis]
MEEQMLFENLDEKLEDELAVITTTWLSINFELPIGEAEGTPETRAKTSIVSSPQVCCPILPISSTFFDTKPGKKVSPKKTIPEKPAVLISKSTDQEEEEEEFLTSAVLRSSKRKRLIFDSDEEEATTDPAEKVPQSRTSPRKSAHRDQKTTPKATKKILAADSETDSPTPKPARGRRPRSGAAATETEREAPIAPLSRESRTTTCSPKKPQASKPKSPVKTNRRRRQVLKTFMDDDGYMVTEKVWESTSENDEEPDEPIRAVHLAVDAKPCVSPSKHDTDARLTGTPTMGSTIKFLCIYGVSQPERLGLILPISNCSVHGIKTLPLETFRDLRHSNGNFLICALIHVWDLVQWDLTVKTCVCFIAVVRYPALNAVLDCCIGHFY